MTAYGAAISLDNTIDYILSSSHISLVGRSQEILQTDHEELQPLQDIMERLDSTRKSKSRKRVNALDGRIKDLIWEFEDKLESLLTDQILSQSRSRGDVLLFSIDLQNLEDDVASLVQKLIEMEKEYIYELENMAEDEDVDESTFGCPGTNSKMFGLSNQFKQLKGYLMRQFFGKHVYALVGMAGIGKTTLAKQIFQDPEIVSVYERRAWVTVGRKPQLDQVSRGILAQLCGIPLTEGDEEIGDGGDKDEEIGYDLEERLEGDEEIGDDLEERLEGDEEIGDGGDEDEEIGYDLEERLEGDEELGDDWKNRLEGKKCLIVLDDVWEREVLNSLISSIPEIKREYIEILVTARERDVIANVSSKIFGGHIEEVPFLDKKESMNLLCHRVFGEEGCPPQLHKATMKIATNCEGLPLMIVIVADILSVNPQNRDPEYWNDVAEKRNSVFTDAYNEISKVLYPTYDYLPQCLKMPFLYMGVFPQDYDVPSSKLISMLKAEGWFLETEEENDFNQSVWDCLHELCMYRNVVLFNKKSIFWHRTILPHMYKTFRLHSTWRHLCRAEARKNKFFHVLNKLEDSEGGVQGHRCLCLENNILFGIKEFCNSVRLNCASITRSLLFLGPYHQYPTPIDVDFKLLRELDVLQLRFYTFPTEILTLVQLKYLALTCNGELPATISKLFNLQVLIVHPHSNIKRRGAPSYVPIQIWDMQALEHIEILGKSLVAPSHVATLEELSNLVGVHASICTISELSTRIPNIKKLGFQIELTPYDDHNNLLSCFGSISTLQSLKTLKCSIISPMVKSGYDFSVTPCLLMLPRGLKKLHLSGMGFPWEFVDVIGSLPYLKVLKLRSYAFRGPTWDAQIRGSFPRLEFLLIEDSDLMRWEPISGSLPKLSYLSMKHCYKLKKICWPSNLSQAKIELVDCSPSALTCVQQLPLHQNTILDVIASTSFGQKPVTIKFQRYGATPQMERPDLISSILSSPVFTEAEQSQPEPESNIAIFINVFFSLLERFLIVFLISLNVLLVWSPIVFCLFFIFLFIFVYFSIYGVW